MSKILQKQLYIIRHGQTEHNRQGIVQGRGVNLSLNETGRKQAEAFFKAYGMVPFERIYTSGLLRSQESVLPFAQLQIPQEAFTELDEISWGQYEGGTHITDTQEPYLKMIAEWENGNLDYAPPDGESPNQLAARQQKFLTHLAATPDEVILICTHGRFLRAFICLLTATPLTEMETIEHQNLCLYKVLLYSDGSAEVVQRCDVEHLKGI